MSIDLLLVFGPVFPAWIHVDIRLWARRASGGKAARTQVGGWRLVVTLTESDKIEFAHRFREFVVTVPHAISIVATTNGL